MKLSDEQKLYVRSTDDKLLRVTAIFPTEEDADSYMEQHPDERVIVRYGSLVFTGDSHDKGVDWPLF